MNMKLVLALIVLALAGQSTAADVSYRGQIRALIKAQCSECHGDKSPTLAEFELDKEKYKEDKTGPRFDSYADLVAVIVWPDAGALMRRLDDGSNTEDKKKGNMYKYLGESDAERASNLLMMKGWVGEGAWKLNRWSQDRHVPGITKEELNKLKLKY